jgi:hypothetical protein
VVLLALILLNKVAILPKEVPPVVTPLKEVPPVVTLLNKVAIPRKAVPLARILRKEVPPVVTLPAVPLAAIHHNKAVTLLKAALLAATLLNKVVILLLAVPLVKAGYVGIGLIFLTYGCESNEIIRLLTTTMDKCKTLKLTNCKSSSTHWIEVSFHFISRSRLSTTNIQY